MNVDRVLYGSIAEETVRVRVTGGQVGQDRLVADGLAELRPGQRVVLLLTDDDNPLTWCVITATSASLTFGSGTVHGEMSRARPRSDACSTCSTRCRSTCRWISRWERMSWLRIGKGAIVSALRQSLGCCSSQRDQFELGRPVPLATPRAHQLPTMCVQQLSFTIEAGPRLPSRV